jgi:hypothetical protein
MRASDRMRTSKNRSMPLTAAMARFADVADIIRSRSEVDEVLRDLCEDYRTARQTLTRIKKEKPRPTEKIAEYTSFVEDLEDEIMRYMLGAERQSKNE